MQYTEPACLQVAASAKISDLLLDKPEGLSVEELANLCGVDAGKLGQVLRFLATKHVYREGLFFPALPCILTNLTIPPVRPNVYANNRLSMKMLSSDPVSCNVGVWCVHHWVRTSGWPLSSCSTDEFMKAATSVWETLADKEYGPSYDVSKTAFYKVHGAPTFQYYKQYVSSQL